MEPADDLSSPTAGMSRPDPSGAGARNATPPTKDGFRVERDTMGEVLVPVDALYQAQTQRAVENFPVSGTGLDVAIVRALADIKGKAALVNGRLGVLDEPVAEAIVVAAAAVNAGGHDGEFPVDVYQTGSGTSTNMNVNEVIATLAAGASGLRVHPNDHVNASQSSNDTFPSAVHLAATAAVVRDLLPALEHLHAALVERADAFRDVVTAGRTHLMDATPVTLGQRFGGYARQIALAAERIAGTIPGLAELPLGGTAVGTGINTPDGFAAGVVAELRRSTGLPLREAVDHFEAQGARDGLVETSAALRGLAVGLTKICNDLRWMGSGPRAGLAEIRIPDLQPGSSIMPGKVNPVIPEAVLMVSSRVVGNDATLAWAGASGSFELNVQIPVMGQALLESVRLMARASVLLADRCVAGIEADDQRGLEYAQGSPSIVTPLNRYLGYERAASVAKQALRERSSIREVVLRRGYVEEGLLSIEQLDAALDVLAMTRPHGGPARGPQREGPASERLGVRSGGMSQPTP